MNLLSDVHYECRRLSGHMNSERDLLISSPTEVSTVKFSFCLSCRDYGLTIAIDSTLFLYMHLNQTKPCPEPKMKQERNPKNSVCGCLKIIFFSLKLFEKKLKVQPWRKTYLGKKTDILIRKEIYAQISNHVVSKNKKT